MEDGSGPGTAGRRMHFLLEVREGFQEEVTFKPEGLVDWGWVGKHLSRRVGMGKAEAGRLGPGSSDQRRQSIRAAPQNTGKGTAHP